MPKVDPSAPVLGRVRGLLLCATLILIGGSIAFSIDGMLLLKLEPLLVTALALIHAGFWGVLLSNLVYLRRQTARSLSEYPTVSICIPARNEAQNLQRLLPSLQAQQYPEFEILVWDDQSEDQTWAVLEAIDDSRVRALRGPAPPTGWIGKVHGLYQCTRHATGDCYLFLDADAEVLDPEALRRLVERHRTTETAVSSGFTRLRGKALLLVSLVPNAILSGLPWPLVRRTRTPALSAVNGQCWMIESDVYHAHEPHEVVKGEVLEDVCIGRYLKSRGHPPSLLDVQDLVAVHMYDSVEDAWRGFRKNAYLLLGGTIPRFLILYSAFILAWGLAPLLSLWFLASLYALKFVTDRASGMPLVISALAPVSYVAGLALQFDSALHHWTDRVSWKGRSVPSSSPSSGASDTP